ncbi:hypothetical protein A2755_03425 [Candidatus Wolfebacteria bacterium RIFCSPHIGHO2_01_FULL_48_22]|uniref:Uncharacterized protein n=2 Tax=Candidatus Wolfeibacteriota TaxID=1752735 RepID=A0A1F8DRX7_9BACT|nr:MAG: hypothetical protein A2755_03425 [Candidatus Wolfebacteria bacterium RIFCSPHIGHO2_01_FULL_48_22]OGM92078.1 MAG: hypothetical protein A2935_01915 [Candidatus Wolfebacteria bacterium RIFCSPLOWO2_01_FULL_47_17b]
MKRTILILIICTVVGSTLGFLVPPRRVHAQADGSGWAIFGEMLAEWGKTILKWVEDELWPVLRDQAVKRIVDDLTDQIIDSIENGGEPLFIQDPLGELQRVGDITFDTFNSYLGSETGVNLCAPFQAELSLYFQTTFQREQPFGLPVQCTFSEFQQALQDSAHLIERGGWVTFQQAFIPSNNFFGASLLVDQAYMNETQRKLKEASDRMNRNLGFDDVSLCTQWRNPRSGDLAVSENEAYSMALEMSGYAMPLTQDQDQQVQNIMEGLCTRRETLTPGSIVAEAATKGVLKDFEYAANVQSIISALINTALSKVFDKDKGGLLAAHSSVRGTSFGYESYTGKTFKDQVDAAIRDLEAKKESYYGINAYLQVLEPKILHARRGALSAIALCTNWYDTNKNNNEGGAIGYPHFGYVIYDPQEGMRVTATLGDLVEIPFASSSPLFADSWETLFDSSPDSNGGFFMRDPTMGEPLAHEGYFTGLERARRAARDALNGTPENPEGISRRLEGYLAELRAIQTNPETGIKNAVIASLQAGPPSLTADEARAIFESASSTFVLEYIADSTDRMNRILGIATREFSDYTSEFSVVVSDAVRQSSYGSGPGNLNIANLSLSATLDSLIQGFTTTPYGAFVDSRPWTGSLHIKNLIRNSIPGEYSPMFFCENRT